MIDGVRAALTEMAVAESMAQHELEAAQEAARNAAAEAVAEGYYKDKEIKKQDKKLGNTKEEVKYPHMMYDPKTGKEVEAKTPEDHEKLSKMGYTHDKPKANAEDKMDPVNPAAAKKKFADRKDKDIDNDGDVDDSDKFLHKRRKAIGKTMAKEQSNIRERLTSIWEDAAGAKRTAGATKPEPTTKDDEDKKMKAGHKVDKVPNADNSDAAEKATKPAAMRGNDNKQAEKNVKPSATKDTANKVVSAKESIDAITAAYEGMKKDG